MADRPIRVAVTGGAGSGKSTVCRIFEKLGVLVFDADRFAREAVEIGTPAYRKIVAHFGKNILDQEGSLNRKLLREIITVNPKAKKALESFVHPEITGTMRRKLDQARESGLDVVMEVPLLFELELENMFDFSIMVYAERESRIGRLEERDNVDRNRAAALVDLQMSDTEKSKRADYVIRNTGRLKELEQDIKKLHFTLFKSNRSHKSA